MDFSSILGYVQTLALLYGWTIVAAVLFSIGERLFRKEPAPEPPANHPAS